MFFGIGDFLVLFTLLLLYAPGCRAVKGQFALHCHNRADAGRDGGGISVLARSAGCALAPIGFSVG